MTSFTGKPELMGGAAWTSTLKVWLLPPGHTILGHDGDQLWYATEDGTGSATPVPVRVMTDDEAPDTVADLYPASGLAADVWPALPT